MVTAISTAWVGVIGALGGVIVTGLIGLVTAVLNHRWQRASAHEERSHTAREAQAALRREAYVRYLAATDALEGFVITRPPLPRGTSASEGWQRLRALREGDSKVFD